MNLDILGLQILDKMRVLSSSSDNVLHTLENISVIRDILSTISDDKSLAIFRAIAEEGTTGIASYIINKDLQLTHKKYYRRLSDQEWFDNKKTLQ